MGEVKVTLPSVEEMRKRLKKETTLAPQVTRWLIEELAPIAGTSLRPEGVVTKLSFIININEKGPHPQIRLLTWALVGAIIEALIDDPEAQIIAIRHADTITRRMES